MLRSHEKRQNFGREVEENHRENDEQEVLQFGLVLCASRRILHVINARRKCNQSRVGGRARDFSECPAAESSGGRKDILSVCFTCRSKLLFSGALKKGRNKRLRRQSSLSRIQCRSKTWLSRGEQAVPLGISVENDILLTLARSICLDRRQFELPCVVRLS